VRPLGQKTTFPRVWGSGLFSVCRGGCPVFFPPTGLDYSSPRRGCGILSPEHTADPTPERSYGMGIFDLFRRPDINAGVAQWQADPQGVLLDVRTREEYAQGHIPSS